MNKIEELLGIKVKDCDCQYSFLKSAENNRINILNKDINIKDNQYIAIDGDTNSVSLYFSMKADNIEALKEHDIFIDFENEKGVESIPVYDFNYKDNEILFTWTINGNAAKSGPLQFQVRFTSINLDTNTYVFNYKTKIATVYILNSIDLDQETITTEYPSLLEIWMAKFNEQAQLSKGDDGDSAYEVAVKNGFEGNEEEWLLSLKGEKGQGNGIKNIEKTSSEGLIDIYTITLDDNSSYTFSVSNGRDGNDGKNGDDGSDGTDGNGIEKIELTAEEGTEKTYTITFTNKETFSFIVSDGIKGDKGDKGDTFTYNDLSPEDLSDLVNRVSETALNSVAAGLDVINGEVI